MDFKQYLESIGAKPGDKLEFVGYTKNGAHSHWGFHNPDGNYQNFRVGDDGYMYSSYPRGGKDYKHEKNWGFIFKVVTSEPQGSIYYKDVHEYCKKNGFKHGDKLEFVRYVKTGHEHWGFHTGYKYKNIRVEERNGLLGIYMNLCSDGTENYLWDNWGFIFKLKEKASEEVSPRPIWCGKLFGKMTEAEKGAFLMDILAGKKAFYGDCGNSVRGPESGDYSTVTRYVERFDKAREPSYRYYSSKVLTEAGRKIRKLEREIEEKQKELAKLLS